MSGLTMALRDGSQVDWEICLFVGRAAQEIRDHKQVYALWTLVKKCQNADFPVYQFPKSQLVLRDYQLIDENDNVAAGVSQVVLNFIEEKNDRLKIYIPTESGDYQILRFPLNL